MKVSKKIYRDKQNQATGPLFIAIVFFALVLFKCYRILYHDASFEWSLWVWIAMVLANLIIWRVREVKLKKYEIAK